MGDLSVYLFCSAVNSWSPPPVVRLLGVDLKHAYYLCNLPRRLNLF